MKTLALSCVLLSAALAAQAHPGHGEHQHPHGFQPSLLGNMEELRAEIVQVQGMPKRGQAVPAPSQPNPAAQAKVWAAEDALVAARLELENQFLGFTKAMAAETVFFAAVPPQLRETYQALVDKGAAAQKKLVDLKVLQPSTAGRYVFAMRGQAPSAEAKKAFEDYVEAMAAFDDSPDADYMLAILQRRQKSQPESVPAPLKAAMDSYYAFTRKMPEFTLRAMMLLAEALEANGGQFNSRWGLDGDGKSQPGRKS
jgi:hypothetical protein